MSGRCQCGVPGKAISLRTGHDYPGEGAETDLSQIVAFVLAQAKWLGPALLAVGVAIRVLGKLLGHILLAAGLLATAAIAYQEWQALHSLPIAGGIFLVGAVVFGLLAWTVRGLSFLFAFVLIAAAFYLLVYGWMGPAFAGTTTASVAWAGATIVTMIVTGFRGGWLHRVPVAAAAAGVLH